MYGGSITVGALESAVLIAGKGYIELRKQRIESTAKRL
jgi:hypothetical protein